MPGIPVESPFRGEPVRPDDPRQSDATGIELPWSASTSVLDEAPNSFSFGNEKPLSEQTQRHTANRKQTSVIGGTVPDPITEITDFHAALAEIRRRWLKAQERPRTSEDFNFELNDPLDYEADRFDRLVVNGAQSVGDLARRLNSRAVFLDDRVRLLGLFGPNAAEAAPMIVARFRRKLAKSDGREFDDLSSSECAEALASIGAPSAGELKVLLREGSPVERRFAIAVVGLLGEKASICVPELISLLEGSDLNFIEAALWGLAAVGPSAADALPQLARTLERDPALRLKAAGALISVGPAAIQKSSKLLNSSDAEVRRVATSVLGRIGRNDPQAVAALVRVIDDSDPGVQRAAIFALSGLGAPAASVVPRLIGKLQGPHQLTVIKALAELGETAAAAVPNLTRIACSASPSRSASLQDFDRSIKQRIASLDAIAQIGQADSASVLALADLLGDPKIGGEPDSSSDQIRAYAARALGSLGQTAAPVVAQLVEVLDKPVTTQFGSEGGYEYHFTSIWELPPQKRSGTGSVKLVSLESLGKIGESSPAVIQACHKSLQDANPAVRVVAANSLIALGQPDPGCAAICRNAVREMTLSQPQAQDSQIALPATNPDVLPGVGPWLPGNELPLYVAAQSLVALKDAGIPVAIELLNAPDLNDKAVTLGSWVLGQIGMKSPEARLSLTRMALGKPKIYLNDSIKQAALENLTRDPSAHAQTLIQLLAEEEYAKSAASALAALEAPAAAPAVPELSRLAKSENVDIRRAAIRALGAAGIADETVLAILVEALKDNEFLIHPEAFKSLCRMGPAAAPYLDALLEYAAPRVAGSGLPGEGPGSMLRRVGDEKVLAALLPQLGKNDAYKQLFIDFSSVGVRSRLKGEKTAKLIAAHLADDNVQVRQLMAQTLRNMGEDARPCIDDLKKAARDKDLDVSWQAMLALLGLLPLDEAVAAAPPSGKADPLKGKLDQVIAQLNAPRQPGEDGLNRLVALRKEASIGYWVRCLKNSDPRIRAFAAQILPLKFDTMAAVYKSVAEDERSPPELKASAEQALQQIEQAREQFGE